MATLMAVKQLSKTFGDTPILTDINFDVMRNEFLTIIGPSGCGKTLLLKLLAGLLTPSTGSLAYQTNAAHSVGMVFQDAALLPWRTVRENIMLPAELKHQSVDRHRVDELIDLVNLRQYAAHYPNHLSGGMKQRVALARALLLDPDILLMDEPFAALDLLTRSRLNVELLRIRNKNSHQTSKTTVFVTHSIEEAVFLSDRVIVLSDKPTTVKHIVDISLPRPRESEDIKTTPEFVSYVQQLRVCLR